MLASSINLSSGGNPEEENKELPKLNPDEINIELNAPANNEENQEKHELNDLLNDNEISQLYKRVKDRIFYPS